jgi:protein TonB
MRFLFLPHAKSAAFAPSALLSVAAHTAFIGAAVYGTGERARALEERRTAEVHYLPPPDRRPSLEAVEEQLQYIEVGAGVATSENGTIGGALPEGEPRPDERHPGGAAGDQTVNQTPQSPVLSSDSVYSILSVEESAVRVEGSAAPVYPAELIAAGVEGTVVARYVIDTTGRADPATLEVQPGANLAFAQSVREALPGMRFTAATVRGRKVRQMVEQSFQFRLAPPAAPAEHTRTSPIP